MARSRNRKERRNESKRIEDVISDDNSSMDKFFIVAAVILFLLCFYILTVHITNKNKDSSDKKEETVELSKDKIVIGRSLSMGKNDYYVIFYDYVYENSLEEMASNYKGELPIYKVNMSLGFNRKYATVEESNKNPTKVSEFKINGPTLIKVSNKKVVEYIEGEDNIRTILN